MDHYDPRGLKRMIMPEDLDPDDIPPDYNADVLNNTVLRRIFGGFQ